MQINNLKIVLHRGVVMKESLQRVIDIYNDANTEELESICPTGNEIWYLKLRENFKETDSIKVMKTKYPIPRLSKKRNKNP